MWSSYAVAAGPCLPPVVFLPPPCQLVAFTYLTWWELSWDVMEPVAYILSLSYSLLAYIYFLYTRGSYFEQKDFKEYW